MLFSRRICVSGFAILANLSLLGTLGSARPGLAEEAKDSPKAKPGVIERHTMTIAGRERDYLIRVPKTPPADGSKHPLMIYLHGGGGKAKLSNTETKPPWIAIAPNAIDKAWNVGGLPKPAWSDRPRDPSIDDIAFIEALIDLAVENEGADPSRVAIAGVSRGGMMAFQALSELNDKINLGVIAIAGLPSHIWKGYQLRRPTHVLIMNGTADNWMKYGGAALSWLRRPEGNRERIKLLPTEQTARELAKLQGLDRDPKVSKLPDTDPDDGCTAEVYEWLGKPGQGSVTLIKVIGGGHTIPGLPQVIPEALVGKTCRDFDGMKRIGEFLNAAPARTAER